MEMPVLKEFDPHTFMRWRRRAEMAIKINNWSNSRARREVVGHLHDDAYDAAAGVEMLTDEDEARTPAWTLLLDALQSVFVPLASTKLAKQLFMRARQMEGESAEMWHMRLRTLHKQSYPAMERANQEIDPQLIENFLSGLANAEIQRYAITHDYENYSTALKGVLKEVSNTRMVETSKEAAAMSASISAMAAIKTTQNYSKSGPSRQPYNGGCFICQGPHFKRQCPQQQQPQNFQQKHFYPNRFTPYNSGNRQRGQSGDFSNNRGRGFQRGRGFGSNRGASGSANQQRFPKYQAAYMSGSEEPSFEGPYPVEIQQPAKN